MHWTLAQVRALTLDEYDELIRWLQEQADRAKEPEGSIDADQLIEAAQAKRSRPQPDADAE
jgi:hypothetical protein